MATTRSTTALNRVEEKAVWRAFAQRRNCTVTLLEGPVPLSLTYRDQKTSSSPSKKMLLLIGFPIVLLRQLEQPSRRLLQPSVDDRLFEQIFGKCHGWVRLAVLVRRISFLPM